ncbi:MAG: hypothetical protein IKD69_06120, partial [Solobacterium sp.]|nr:hypothetical protein [Solobacterium sp.]
MKRKWLIAAVSSAMLTMILPVQAEDHLVWKTGSDGKRYWYENGQKQGVSGDPKNIWDTVYGLERGREIYDPASDAWYWLDAIYDGAAAFGKEVWMPYIYQDEDNWDDATLHFNADHADEGMADYTYQCMKNKSGKWIRYDENGKMIKGWVTISGVLAQLYQYQAGNTYYYDTMTGLMAKGDITIDGNEYHFDELTGALDNGNMTLEADKDSFILGKGENEVYLYLHFHAGADGVSLQYGPDQSYNSTVLMKDDGTGADDIADDGVYSAKVSLSDFKANTYSFHASYLAVTSNTVAVQSYQPLSVSAISAMKTVNEEIDALLNSEEYISLSNGRKKYLISDLLRGLEGEGLIQENSIGFDDDNEFITFIYPEGVYGGVLYAQQSTGTQSLTLAGNDSEMPSAAINSEADVYKAPYKEDASLSCLILNSFPAFETKQSSIDYRTGFYETLKKKWDDKGMQTSLIVDPTVDDYRNFGDYNVVCVSTHGTIGTWTETTGHSTATVSIPIYVLHEAADDNKNKKYELELMNHDLIVVNSRYSISPQFFKHQYENGELNDTHVFSECCKSMGTGHGTDSSQYDYSMANAIMNKGARSYVGFHNSVLASYCRLFMEKYIDVLLEGRYSFVAFDEAVKDQGENDAVWYANNSDETKEEMIERKFKKGERSSHYDAQFDIAYPVRRYNWPDELTKEKLYNGGFEQQTGGRLRYWSWNGDMRVVTKLGTIK